MAKRTLKQIAPFLTLAAIALAAAFVTPVADFADTAQYNPADIAWVIVAAALVFLMTPGLAFFYGGMAHRKNVISTMMKNVVAAGAASVLWIFVGYSLCFDEDIGGFIGNPATHLFFKDVNSGEPYSAFFFTQLKAMLIAVGYSFAVSFIIFKFINFILPLRVSAEEEELGLDATQHDEKYLQGTLLAHNNDKVKEEEVFK